MDWNTVIGCDISKHTIAYCVRTPSKVLEQGELQNSHSSVTQWLNAMRAKYGAKNTLIGMEHTGVYTKHLLSIAYAKTFTLWLESARQIQLSLGMQRGKSDQVDAQRIAEYLMRYADRAQPWQPPRSALAKLRCLQRTRDRLIKSQTQLSVPLTEKNFMSTQEYTLMQRMTQPVLQKITQQINRIEEQIDTIITQDEQLHQLKQYVTSVPGVGNVLFTELVIKTNAFTDYRSAKQLACMAGVAPFEHTSGTSVNGRTRVSHRADKRLKTLLHMGAMSAIRSPGEIQSYYLRKVSEGKNKMSVLNAVRNKLLHRIFAVARNQVMYQKNFQYHLAIP